MRELYTAVMKILNHLDFERIWNGFSAFRFALYDSESVYFDDSVIPVDKRFLGNTAIEFNGEQIAIWHVQSPKDEDPELLAANLTHEMFHAFQRHLGETRFPSDLIILDYPNTKENLTYKYFENQLLVEAFLQKDKRKQQELISQFISARKYRGELIGDIILQEFKTETIEGMAEYAGSSALKQISEEKYNNRIHQYLEFLKVKDGLLFNTRQLLYYSGAVFCLLLSEAGVSFQHEIGNTDDSLFEWVALGIPGERPKIKTEPELLSNLQIYTDDKQREFKEFLQQHKEVVSGNYIICGYDPMNMKKDGTRILCTHFIMLRKAEGEEEEPVFVKGPVMVILRNNSYNRVTEYIR